jgi:hypothetical protein
LFPFWINAMPEIEFVAYSDYIVLLELYRSLRDAKADESDVQGNS